MIISRLCGGLGNQMFQYAAGRRLALTHGLPLHLDLRWFETQTKRRFELTALDVDATIITDADWHEMGPPPPVFSERFFHFDPAVLDAPADCFLDGYWQSPRYFADIDPIIRADFLPVTPMTDFELRTAALLKESSDPVVLHVRHGDYVSEAHTAAFHGVCGTAYYRRAMDIVRSLVPGAHFFMFSDDPEWVSASLAAPDATTIWTPDTALPFENIRLMSMARHHIIANSTYSWWACWLADKDERSLSIAPRPWFAAREKNTEDLIPPTWITLGNP